MTADDPLLQAVAQSIAAYCEARHDFAFDPAHPAVRLHDPAFGAAEIVAAVEPLLTTRVTAGTKVRAFEKAFAAHHHFGAGVMVNSGSSANLLAIAALTNPAARDRLEPGSEVIVSALSWSTTIWPLVQCGLVPVIVDIDPQTLNIDPAAAERAIGPKTRALMPVHVYGNPCHMDALTDICARHDLILIEDCCEALGARYDGNYVGSFGRVGTYSFYFSHHITTLEGGICVTGAQDDAELMRVLRAHGWIRELDDPTPHTAAHPDIDPKFLFVNAGYNLRVTEPQAAMGLVQLDKLEGFVDIRRHNAARLGADLEAVSNHLRQQQETPKGRHSWFGFPLIVQPGAPFDRAAICRHLNAQGIETRPLIAGNIAAQPGMKLFEHRIAGPLTEADTIMSHGFSVGNHQGIDDAARDYVAETIKAFVTSQS
ncbi:lipopolysaccharide biosynthesis protein RfbH [Magnetospira thiophila]